MTEIATPYTTRLSGDYAPATFEERGATVPFQKPELANARIRKNAHGDLEALVYGFSGGRGVYVLPWRAIPDLLRLNLHDLTLHAEVLTTNAVTPERLQVAAYRVARSGLAGEEMLEAAEEMLVERAQVSSATALYLLRRLLPDTRLAADGSPMTPALLGTPTGKAAARAALQSAAAAGVLAADADTAFDRVQKMASLALAVGTDAGENPGELRSLFGRVRDFAAGAGADTGDGAALVAEVARLTVAIGEDLIRETDRELSEPGAFLKDWDARSQRLKHTVERLRWLLDGWRPVCDLWSGWSGAAGDPMLMLTTLRILPLVPRDECGRFHADAGSLYQRQSSVFGKMQDEA